MDSIVLGIVPTHHAQCVNGAQARANQNQVSIDDERCAGSGLQEHGLLAPSSSAPSNFLHTQSPDLSVK